MSHADILDEPERLRGPFWGSVLFHISLAAVMLGYTGAGIGKAARTPGRIAEDRKQFFDAH